MEIENHKEEVPFAHYAGLFRDLDPQDVTARLRDVSWDGEKFKVALLGREYEISHPEYAITPLDGGAMPPLPTQTFLLRYLLESRDVPWGGQWKTFREMPWGEMYIKPYSGRVHQSAGHQHELLRRGKPVDAEIRLHSLHVRADCRRQGRLAAG